MEEYAEISEQSRLGCRGAGELQTDWSRVRGCEEGAGGPALGQVSLANKDQTSEGTVTLPESRHLPRGPGSDPGWGRVKTLD